MQSALDAPVWSLINQTRPPDLIVVIDDGSVNPVRGFDHPLVSWQRQENTGKRGAQCTVLRGFDRDDFAFIMTVDSDSAPDPDALEHLRRAMSDPRVEASTGMIYIRNFEESWVSRGADMDIGMSCVMMRASRSALGCLETTSGALAVYSTSLLYEHLDADAVVVVDAAVRIHPAQHQADVVARVPPHAVDPHAAHAELERCHGAGARHP